VIGSFD